MKMQILTALTRSTSGILKPGTTSRSMKSRHALGDETRLIPGTTIRSTRCSTTKTRHLCGPTKTLHRSSPTKTRHRSSPSKTCDTVARLKPGTYVARLKPGTYAARLKPDTNQNQMKMNIFSLNRFMVNTHCTM